MTKNSLASLDANVNASSSSSEPPVKRIKLSDQSTLTSLTKSSFPSNSSDSQEKIQATEASTESMDVKMSTTREDGDVELKVETGNASGNAGDEGTGASEEQDREVKAGIHAFVDAGVSGFRGVLKMRYTDFLVNEIALDGSVLHLTNDRAPKPLPAPKWNDNKGDQSNSFENLPENGAKDVVEKVEPVIVTSTTANPRTTSTALEIPVDASNQEKAKKELEPPKSGDAEFELNSADEVLLVGYFGEDFKNKILEFHRKILAKPTAKPRDFGNILSEPITDREKRGRLHADVRRIFLSRLETESCDGAIKISAASQQAVKNHGKPPGYSANTQQKGGRNNRNQTKGKLGWDELGGQYLHFTLYKENKDTMEVVSHMSRVLRVKPKDFAFSGTKDRRAVTAQRVSIFRQRAEELAKLNPQLRQARIGNFSYEKQPLSLGELNGNFFTIALRDCHFDGEEGLDEVSRLQNAKETVGKCVELAQKHGFINYYGLQRFGTFAISNDIVGAMILKNDFEGAVKAILDYNPALLESDTEALDRVGRDDIARARAINMFETTGQSNEALNLLPRRFNGESSVIRHLGNKNNKTDFLGALRMINRNLKLMYVHAYQSLVWNAAASKRWELYGGEVVEGDLVIVDAAAEAAEATKDEIDENGEIVIHPAGNDVAVKQDNFERARPLSAAEVKSGKYTIFDVVLPTPGFDVEYPQNEVGDFYKSFMGSEKGGYLDPADMRRGEKDFSLSGNYRKLLNTMEDLSFDIKLYHSETEQLTETDLEILEKGRLKSNHNYNGQQQNGRYENKFQQSGYGGRGGFNTRGAHGQNGKGRYDEQSNGRQRVTGDIRLEDPNFVNTKAPPVTYATVNTDTQSQGAQNNVEHAAKIAAWNGFHNNEKTEIKVREEAQAAQLARGEIEEAVEQQMPEIQETWIQTSVGQPGGQRQVIGRSTTIVDKDGESTPVLMDASPETATSIQEPIIQPIKIIDHNVATVTGSAQSTALPDIETTAQPAPLAAHEADTTMESISDIFSTVLDNQTTTTTDNGDGVLLEPKIAVIFKFALGPSTYATMALRELMKAGGVAQYKPDFSLGR